MGALLNAFLWKGNLDFGTRGQEIFEIKDSFHNKTHKSMLSVSDFGSIGYLSKEVYQKNVR